MKEYKTPKIEVIELEDGTVLTRSDFEVGTDDMD